MSSAAPGAAYLAVIAGGRTPVLSKATTGTQEAIKYMAAPEE